MLSLPRKTLISCGFLPHGVGACQRGGKSSSPPSRTECEYSEKGPGWGPFLVPAHVTVSVRVGRLGARHGAR